MSDIHIKLIEQLPVAVALIYLVVIFLRSIDRRDERFGEMQKNLQRDWAIALAESTKITTKVIEQDTIALKSTADVIDRNNAAMIKFTEYIQMCRYRQQLNKEVPEMSDREK